MKDIFHLWVHITTKCFGSLRKNIYVRLFMKISCKQTSSSSTDSRRWFYSCRHYYWRSFVKDLLYQSTIYCFQCIVHPYLSLYMKNVCRPRWLSLMRVRLVIRKVAGSTTSGSATLYCVDLIVAFEFVWYMSLTIPNLVPQRPFCYLNFTTVSKPQKIANETYNAHFLASSKNTESKISLKSGFRTR